ncbi:interferon-induced very large GTPase 1-like [Puntigrus tetrazona]|uniref:interferon-induced very large GTPase 1-like n=1 Tax=Puntigrus tetrazona TaxID=1606681 RepID=UPI001C8A3FA4|nr:interferon-induced very large GTPase 1-like [Puntigrus tetrazona]XP_043085153.1 interferon-induced very large GTPase 1-like [Puntigrus tetrazona]
MNNIFQKLCVEGKHLNKLGGADFLQITEYSLQSSEYYSEEELIQTFLQKLLMMNYRARYIKINETNKQDQTQQTDNDLPEEETDFFDDIFEKPPPDKASIQSDPVHPMDVQMAVFHCADGFLKQLMVTKLSQCQYALPLLVPDPFTQQIEFPLWTFRQINKSWNMKNTDNEIISKTQSIYNAKTPMVCFFRFGSLSSSKSQLMNNLINETHNTFFHRNCPGSSRTRVLMDGVVEIAWYCPSGAKTDKFTDCVAFCNLHGDAGKHEKQLQILTEMASINVVVLPRLERNDRHAAKIQNLYKDRKPLICLIDENNSSVSKTNKGKFKIGLKDRNQADVSEELRKAINACLLESSSSFRLEDVSEHSDITVDEEDDDDCKRGREAAQQMISMLKMKELIKIKESFLPHQGKLWHQWCQKNKELHRPQGEWIEMEINTKKTQMNKIRKQQHEFDISHFIKCFIEQIYSYDRIEKMFFLKWFRILLDEHTSADISALRHNYHKKWSTVLQLKERHAKSEQLETEQTELETIAEELQAATFGLEHIMRDFGQIFESCSSVNKNKEDLQVHFSSLPSLAAEMIISGFPLELMDGDAAHVPLVWISAVLEQLTQKLGDHTRIFILSVLGIQSSGKSTMLNAMFGLDFAVSAGRCTKGAFMQLVRVSDEMKTQMNIDYILVVDTEGLRAPELVGKSTRHHDNEFATFVIGLANLTLINIFGENTAEMQDILQIVVQAFMRMKKVRLNPSCVFVHQNVADVAAKEKTMEARRQLLKKLDMMTKLAAKEEVYDAETFSDVIKFDVKNDVKYFAQFWEGNPPMATPNPNYCENIQELKKCIMSHASKSHRILLKDFKTHIKDLWEALLNENFVFSFRNTLEISVYRKLENEYSKWSWSLYNAKLKVENKLHNKIQNEVIHEVEETYLLRELNNTSEEVEKSMSEFFEKDTYAEILIQWKTSFENKIKDLKKNIVRETKTNINKILNHQVLKKRHDQITHLENTLFGTSKELALNFKGKANDEETLKKEFNLFWKMNIKIISDNPSIRDIGIINAKELFDKKKDEHYSIFQKYCNGATPDAVFGEIICQKLKEPIEQSVYKKTARDLTDEIRSKCESLNGSRSNLEKHILKTLAEEENFDKYMNYIKTPRDHFKRFIRDKVGRYINDQFSLSVLLKMKENTKLLQQEIIKAAHKSTEHVQVKTDVSLWLKSFTQQLSDELIFSEKDFSGVKHDDVNDVNVLEDVIRKELPAIMSDIKSKFNTNTFPVKLDRKDRPDELLIDHFCQCCWVQCPFCKAICTNTIENHDGDHSVDIHRNIGLNGWFYRGTTNLSITICTSGVASDRFFYPDASDVKFPWREYRKAGGVYADWNITPDISELPYWKWVVCRFQKDLEKYYNKTFDVWSKIPDEWRTYSKQKAVESLDKYIFSAQSITHSL